MSESVIFFVPGQPRPKQSFRVGADGAGYTDPGVKQWQEDVGWEAKRAMIDRDQLIGRLEVTLVFWRRDWTRVDCDNLSKAVLDGMKQIVFQDDDQVIDLHVHKRISKEHPGCRVIARSSRGELCEEFSLF